MRKVLVTASTFKALEVEEIKLRPELRITTDTDDQILQGFIHSAVEAYQEFTDHILCSSIWDLYLDEFPDEIELPAPLISVTSITYTDSAGVSQTLGASTYVVDTTSAVKGRVVLAYGEVWPSTYAQINVVRVRFVSGYANAAAIPWRVKDGLILKVQELYDGIDRSGLYEPCWIGNARLAI